MKISKKAYYGLRAILALASATRPVSGHDLAVSENLPEDYLEKILQELRQGGFVVSHKGTQGGYNLARDPQEISAWEIIRRLDGPLKMYAPTSEGVLPCLQVSHCQANKVIRVLEQDIEASLGKLDIRSLTKQPIETENVC